MTDLHPAIVHDRADARHMLCDRGVVDAFGHACLRPAVYRAVLAEMGARTLGAGAARDDGQTNRAWGLWHSEATGRH